MAMTERKTARRALLAGGLLAWGFATGALASAPNYLGKFCWSAKSPDGEPIELQLGAIHLGGINYSFSGAVYSSDDRRGQVVHGSGVVTGDDVLIHLMSGGSNDADDAWSWSITVELKLNTLNGTWSIMETVNDENGYARTAVSTDPVTTKSCSW